MLEQPPEPLPPEAPQGLAARIGAAVAAAGGALPFDEFMVMALYHPELGYYTRDDRQRVGRGGDFVTSVSVGRCFGMLLARHLAPVLESMAQSGAGELTLAEPGAEGGELAVDMVAELCKVLPATVFSRLRYVAIEPFESKRRRLRESLRAGGLQRFEVLSGWGELRAARGAVVANEVLDALPVKRLRLAGGEWCEVGVAESGGRFTEVLRPLPDGALAEQSASWPRDLGDGFTVEHCPGLAPWVADLAAAFDELHACLIDYGLARSAEFFDPGRRAGTLRAYGRQQLLEDPLAAPGEIDLTAHVDFERAARAAEQAGLEVYGLTDQHRFLTRAARGWLLEIEARGGAPNPQTAKLLRQFQSLSHPAAMGMAFKVLEVGKRAELG